MNFYKDLILYNNIIICIHMVHILNLSTKVKFKNKVIFLFRNLIIKYIFFHKNRRDQNKMLRPVGIIDNLVFMSPIASYGKYLFHILIRSQ